MKRIISVAIGATILFAGVCVVYAEGDELTTRSNVKTTDNETLHSSNIPLQKTTPRHENRSEVVNKFRETAYSFSLGFDYVDFEEEISYKDEESAKERLQSVTNYLNTLTDNGKDFSAAENLQRNDEWKKFVEDVARLKYEDFDKSEILNDLNVAGALILQAEMHKDKPSLQYLYETINDLNSVVQGNSDKNGITRTFGNDSFEEVQSYLKSKL
ncbi:hypothetical protein C6W27_08950 [Bacillus paralicheniformis]|uniref:hypothetical protein n=1 Tax=Bacillus paralicheniformis TaxID=1648923 RepID=UPI000D023D46|nr:hypothetical protein [Bacillus paralicheniformis]PRS16518.1 hypothetical protein C6W27_08950 [Bacillus paralicheniformis]